MNKPDPNKGNVANFPGSEKPQEYHDAHAKELRPDDLSKEELAIWDRVAPELSKVSRLKPLFVDAIAEYCRVTRRIADARELLDDKDWIYVTTGRHGKQMKSRPEVAQLNDDWRKWRSLVTELGMTPSAERLFSDAQLPLFPGGDDGFNQF